MMRRILAFLILLVLCAAAHAQGGSTATVLLPNITPVSGGVSQKLFFHNGTKLGELGLGTGLSISGGNLNAAATTSPGGASGTVQWNSSGSFDGISGWTTNGTTNLAGGASTTLVVGGCTLGSNVFCTTGPAAISGALTLGTSGILVGGTNAIQQRNAAAAQDYSIFNTFTSGTNFENATLGWSTTSNIFTIATGKGSGGGTNRGILIMPSGSGASGGGIYLPNANAPRLSEIDFSSATDLISGTVFTRVYYSSAGYVVLDDPNGSGIVKFGTPAANVLQHGPDNAASPVAQTTRVQSVVAGTSNTAGVKWTRVASLSTGSGLSGDVCDQTGGTGAGATSQNAAADVWCVKGGTQVVQLKKPYTVATLPTCDAGATGSISYVTDALAPAFLTALVGGGAVITPTFCNGTNWIGF